MTNPSFNAPHRKNVLRAIALAGAVVLGAALPLAAPAMARDVHHGGGWHGGHERWHGGFGFDIAPVYPAQAYADPYYYPPYYPAPAGVSVTLPNVGLFFHVR